MKSEVYTGKVNTIDGLFDRIMNSVALLKQERHTTSGELHVILSRELKSALKSMVGCLNTYFERLQFIETIYMTNKCNQ
jgi:hypothetical protein